jgi:hypothetical protein
MRRFVAPMVGTLALIPGLVLAQGMKNDPNKAVEGAGISVSGWTGRVDFPQRGEQIEQAKFATMGSGMHITTGPHVILWNPANVAKGNYTVHANLTKTQATAHEESYGIFIGGSNLDADNQNYLYCVVFGAGDYSVIIRDGAQTQQVVRRQPNDAVAKAGDNGSAKDDIAMTVSGDKISCAINGKEVWSAPKSEVVGPGKLASTDGIYGLRASHNLSIHVAGFGTAK